MEENRAKDQAMAQLSHITEMVTRLRHATNCDGTNCTLRDDEIPNIMGMSDNITPDEIRAKYHDLDDARETIWDSPISVQVRSDWQNLHDGDSLKPYEYNILMCTGGPAVRIVGEIGESSPRIEYQDWGTPWTELTIDDDERQILVDYVGEFIS